jgi:hypothetical protein
VAHLVALSDDSGRDTNRERPSGDIGQDHGIRTDHSPVSDMHAAENLCSDADLDVITENWDASAAIRGAANHDLRAYQAPITNPGTGMNDHRDTPMRDARAGANFGAQRDNALEQGEHQRFAKARQDWHAKPLQ